jgi:flagellar operon protein
MANMNVGTIGKGPLGLDEKNKAEKAPKDGISFDQALTKELDGKPGEMTKASLDGSIDSKAKSLGEKPVLKFSNHAVERMSSRGISFSPEEITKFEAAAQKAAQKGGKEALLVSDDNALIVSLKTNTVVTVLDRNALKDNVFTNIDSTVIV